MKNPKPTLGKIVRHFKARTAKFIRDSSLPGFRWQRNYYEHIVRNQADLDRIRQYIAENPIKWFYDDENTDTRRSQP